MPAATQKTDAIFAGLESVQKFLSEHGIGKTRENKAQGFNFRGIDDVLNALSSALVQGRVVIIPRVLEWSLDRYETEKSGKGGSGTYTQVTFVSKVLVSYRFISTVDGSETQATIPGMAFDQSDKAVNKALAAAYKYMAFQSFCIPLEGLDDSDSEHITMEGGAPQAPSLPVTEERDDPTEAEAAGLCDSIRGAANLDDLKAAFEVAYKWARNRKLGEHGKAFKALYDERKTALEEGAKQDGAEDPQE